MKKIILIFVLVFVLTSCSFSASISSKYIYENKSLQNKESLCIPSDAVFYASSLKDNTVIQDIGGTNVAIPVFEKEELNAQLINEIKNYIDSVDLPFRPINVDFYISEAFNTITYTFFITDSQETANNYKFYFSVDKDKTVYKNMYDFMSKYRFDKLMHDLYKLDKTESHSIEVLSNGVNVHIDGTSYFISSSYFQTESQFSVFYPDSYNPVTDNNEKYVALTFDDGPNPYTTNSLLKILKENDVKATFFMVGYNILEYPSLVNKIYLESHDIGIHSYKHSDYSQMKFDEVLEDINSCSDLVYDIIGKRPYLVRPPYGNIKTNEINTKDYFFVNWNVDPYDWKSTSPTQIAQEAIKAVKSGSIILLHDIYNSSCQAAEIIIKQLKADGYRFVTISEYFDLDGKKSDNKLHFYKEDYNVK